MPEPPFDAISTAILAAPGWARVGITMPDSRMREQAAEALARAIVDGLRHIPDTMTEDQLALPI
ncbi:DUF6771 family protein [Sphingomonas sp. JC676]|uniref:DUF6771 family protein n=1 Tax=Sphingomonas sp. JC676 TaxID=2768065 RepID=UPI00223B9236|nr:DUF6771 family protein [Sphingomonas sp. JC676]